MKIEAVEAHAARWQTNNHGSVEFRWNPPRDATVLLTNKNGIVDGWMIINKL